MFRVSLLGDFRIQHGDTLIHDVNTPRLQSLVAYLILHRGMPQSRALLAYTFWPDTNEAQSRTNLRNLLHHLRQVLPEADTTLEVDIHSICWRVNAASKIDVEDFRAALHAAENAKKSGDATLECLEYEKAFAFYRGDLMPGCYDDWIIPHREDLRQAYMDMLEKLVHLLEEKRDYQAAIVYAQHRLRADPVHEATYRHLIRLFALNNDRASALRAYHSCVSILKHELDVEPGAATRELYEQLLGADSSPLPSIPASSGYFTLVGREAEWLRMVQAWKAASAGAGHQIMMISGVAGIGKTRLVEELLQWANRQGITTASARCYAAEGSLAYGPVTAWLRSHPLREIDDVWLEELGRLLPEVLSQRTDLPRPALLTDAWQRQHLFEALSRAILKLKQPILLFIDDLQWCDHDTLEWLHFLLRFDPHARFLVVGTFRPEEILESHPLEITLRSLRAEDQVTELELQPLDENATISLLREAAGSDIDPDLAQWLFIETEGNPLFVVETVRAGLDLHRSMMKDSAGRQLSEEFLHNGLDLPPRVQSVLITRLAQLSKPSQELAGLAATIGREFSFALLAKASGKDAETLIRELDELWQRRIIREHGANNYDFSHDKLREAAYKNTSLVKRKYMHQQVGQALELLHAADLDSFSHQIAAHFEQAGLLEEAVPFYLRAAQVARQVYANDEAISLLNRGIQLIEEIDVRTAEQSMELAMRCWEELGDIHEMRALHAEAKQAYQNAFAAVALSDRISQARLHRKTGVVLREERRYLEALDTCDQAEADLGKPADPNTDDWWREWTEVQVERIWANYWLAQWPEMERLVQKTQPVVQEIGGARLRARFLMATCLMHLRRERYTVSEAMIGDAVEAVKASREWGDLKTRIECQFELGFLHLWRRELDEAEENLQLALGMIETSGFVPMRILSLTYLTVVNRFRKKVDEVSEYARRAMLGAETAHMPDYIAAAKGNLAWVAWRRQDLHYARQMGQEAMQIWEASPLLYPFQWQALWPLIGVTLAEDDKDDTWSYLTKLVHTTQQLLPDELACSLTNVIQAKDQAGENTADIELQKLVTLASEMGYL